MVRHPWRFLLAALFLGWSVDFLFYKKPAGVSYPIWILTGLLVLGLLALSERKRPSPWNLVIALGALAMASLVFLRAEGLTRVLGGVSAVLLMILLSAAFTNGFWVRYRLLDYIPAAFWVFIGGVSRCADLFKSPVSQSDVLADGTEKITWREIWRRSAPVLRGLLLAIPVIALLAALLSSADLVFAERLGDWLKFLKFQYLGEYLFRFFYVLILAYVMGGVLVHSFDPKPEAERPDPHKTVVKPFLGTTEALVVLGAVILLFAVFVTIQFRYLFGGEANITETGFTYAEYARRGFGELVAVAIISLGLYLVLATVTKKETLAQKRWFTIMSVFLMALVEVILASAFQRLVIYENAYGWTRMRIYPFVFIAWLGALLLAVIFLEIFRQRGRFGLAMLVFCTGYVASLGILNVDAFVATQNIERARRGTKVELDINYIKELSADAVPVLAAEFDASDLPQQAHDALGADLACRTAELADQQPLSWQSFSLSEYQAQVILKTNAAKWAKYETRRNDRNWIVTLNGEEIDCEPNRFID